MAQKRQKIDLDPLVSKIVARNKSDWPKVVSEDPTALTTLLHPHDQPHENSKLEWWYINGHLDGTDGNISFFAAFFRLFIEQTDELGEVEIDKDSLGTGIPSPGYWVTAVNWALIDRTKKKYETFSYVDKDTPAALLQLMESGLYPGDPHMIATMADDVFRCGHTLLPDRLQTQKSRLANDKLDVMMEKCHFFRRDASKDSKSINGFEYVLNLEGQAHNAKETVSFECVLAPTKAPVLSGEKGVVAMSKDQPGEDMFYYFLPRCTVSGAKLSRRVGKFADPTVSTWSDKDTCVGWIDHEFGGTIARTSREFISFTLAKLAERKGKDVGWDWVAIQLSNDTEVSISMLYDPETHSVTNKFGVVRVGNSASQYLQGDNVEFKLASSDATWTSPATQVKFPIKWKVQLTLDDKTKVSLLLAAPFPEQEFVTLAAKPSFWEGYCEVVAGPDSVWGATPVTGHAFLESRGEQDPQKVEKGYEQLNQMLLAPLLATVKPPADLADRDPSLLIPMVTPSLAMVAAMIAAAGLPALEAKHQAMLADGCAAAIASRNAKQQADIDRAATWLEKRWRVSREELDRDLRFVMLRSFVRFAMADAQAAFDNSQSGNQANGSGNCAAAAAVELRDIPKNEAARETANIGFEKTSFVEPPREALTSPCKQGDMEACKTLFTGTWRLDKSKSEALNEILCLEQVNLVVRQLTDRVQPTLKTTVNSREMLSHVTTMISNTEHHVTMTGEPYKWFSSGRGNLTSFYTLQDGGRTSYMRSHIPPESPSVEHKWCRVLGDDTHKNDTFVEFYRFDPTGEKSEKSKYCTRFFVRLDE